MNDGFTRRAWREGHPSSIGDLLQERGSLRVAKVSASAGALAPVRDPQPSAASIADAERLFEETNVLRLEGLLFCFDPREARRRTGKLSVEDGEGRRVEIELHPSYGQPSVLAYRVLQAIFKKLSDQGLPASGKVSFSQRELARLVGRAGFGGHQSQQLFHALMQLHRTGISAELLDKETKEWARADFLLVTSLLTSGRGTVNRQLSECVVQLEPKIVESLRKRHWACFNWTRMQQLEPIGMAIYKRLHRHFSNLYETKATARGLRFEKDYEDLLGEWLGGLKPEGYVSRIEKQLGPHLDAITETGLLSKWAVAKRADGRGFKLTFWPGKGFFEDYEGFYRNAGIAPRATASADVRAIQQPHEIVAHFHERRGHSADMYDAKEVAFASQLLDRYGLDEVRSLIDWSIAKAEETRFEMRYLMAIRQYVPLWQRTLAMRRQREEQEGHSAE